MKHSPQFRMMKDRIQRALIDNSDEVQVRFLELAGRIAQVRIIGREMSALLRPVLRHLEVGEGPIELKIDVLDEDCSGRQSFQGTEKVSFQLSEDYAVQSLNQTRSILARKESHLLVEVKNRASLSAYETGRPWHAPLAIWHLDHDTPLIHAGAVVGESGGLLIGGPSGSGKSHTCLQCAFAGSGFLGDDMVGLNSRAGSFTAHSLYGSTFLERGDLRKFPELKAEILSSPHASTEKALAIVPVTKIAQCPIKAVVLPKLVRGSTEAKLREAKPAEVLLGLGPSTIQVGRLSPGPLAFEMLAELARTTPSYHLELGTGVTEVLGELLN